MTSDKIQRRGIGTPRVPPKSKPPNSAAAATPPLSETDTWADGSPRHMPSPKAKGESKCIYFNDGNELSMLEGIAGRVPRCTVSRIINQLTKAFVEAASKQLNGKPDERMVEVTVKVYL